MDLNQLTIYRCKPPEIPEILNFDLDFFIIFSLDPRSYLYLSFDWSISPCYKFESLLNLGLSFKTCFWSCWSNRSKQDGNESCKQKQIDKQKNKQKHFCLQDHQWNKKVPTSKSSKTNPISKARNSWNSKVSLFQNWAVSREFWTFQLIITKNPIIHPKYDFHEISSDWK